MKKKPICLIIRDGWGRGEEKSDNAIWAAKTPFTDKYEKKLPDHLNQDFGD